MPMRFDIKTLPKIAVLSPEQRRKIELQACSLAIRDWRTWAISAPMMAGCFFVVGYLSPKEEETGQLIWAIGGSVVGILFFSLTLLVMVNQHAARIAASFKSMEGDAANLPLAKTTDQTPQRSNQPLSLWLKIAGLLGLLVGSALLYFGISNQAWGIVGVGTLLLTVGIVAVTRCALCRSCGNLNVSIGERCMSCASCGTPFLRHG